MRGISKELDETGYWETLEGGGGLEARNLWVYVENTRGHPTPLSLAVLGRTRGLADTLGCRVEALSFGEGIEGGAQSLIHHGADTVYFGETPAGISGDIETVGGWLLDLIKKNPPEFLLLGASALGRELAGFLAGRLKAAYLQECSSVDVEIADRRLMGVRAMFGRRINATLVCERTVPQIATVAAGAYRTPHLDRERSGRVVKLSPAPPSREPRVKIRSIVGRRGGLLEEALVLIGLGDTLGGEEDLGLGEELAGLLGGMAIPPKEVEGLAGSGRRLKPKIFIALGVRGDPSFLAALGEATRIVAINPDPDDPLHRAAWISVLGDPRATARAWVGELKREEA